MTNEEYMKATQKFAIYPADTAIEYIILGIASEAGEVAGKMAKYYRGDYDAADPLQLSSDVDKEVGDLLWFISQYCNDTGTTFSKLMQMNIDKLTERKARGTIRGSGDER